MGSLADWGGDSTREYLHPGARQGDNPDVEETLLVIEDDPSLREVVSIGLEGQGFRAVAAEDGPAPLLAFATLKPDLVLLDVMLPGLDGITVCGRWSNHHRRGRA